ncbi:MAG: hypothetical protein RSB67_03560 [Clostridia bacterium]
MKIVVALNNSYIKEELSKIYKNAVYEYDILDMEAVLEFLSKNKDEKVIILTKDTLSGKLEKKFYIKHLRLAHDDLKIIYFVKELTKEYKEFLFANEVFNIIEGDFASLDDIKESISTEQKVVYKNVNNMVMEPKVKYKIQNQIIQKQIIAVFGTSGAGKSTIASLIAKNIADKLNIETCLTDMDIQNPGIDLLNNISLPKNSLTNIMDEIDKYKNIGKIIDENINKNKKLSYITSDISIYDAQNRISQTYYNKIYENIAKKFDYNIIDITNTIFLDVVEYTLSKASKIIFVINPNYLSIRQALKYLNVLNRLWNIPIENIGIVVNKVCKNSLEMSQIKSILKGYSIVLSVNYVDNLEGYINGSVERCKIDFNIDELGEFFGIKKKQIKNSNKKEKFFSSIIGGKNDS